MCRKFWLRTVGPRWMSVWGIEKTTNNAAESLHGRINARFASAHPNLYVFLKNLNCKYSPENLTCKKTILYYNFF